MSTGHELRCIELYTLGSVNFGRLAILATTVIVVFAVSLLPFINHLPQLLSRLFPFKRGLNHAYWAPNIWAVITAIDRLLLWLTRRSSYLARYLLLNIDGVDSASRGLVGDTVFAILPNIKPMHTLILTTALQTVRPFDCVFSPAKLIARVRFSWLNCGSVLLEQHL